MKASTVEVIKLGDEALKEWRDAMVPIWKEFEDDIGPEIMKAAKTTGMTTKK